MAEPMYEDLTQGRQDRMTISVGPHHPSTHGVLRLVIELEGETILSARPEHGYIHTGIEKHAENLNWTQAITVIDRMDYTSPLSNNLAFVLAAEKLLGIEVPPKAQIVRVLLAELNRIAAHLIFVGTGVMDLGAMSVFFYAFDIREGILDLFEETTGARMHTSWLRVGGLASDLPPNFRQMVGDYLARFPQRLQELRDLIDQNPIVIDRLKGVGKITAEAAINHGLTGPNLRATGVNYDVRKAFPYCGYETYDFDVPLGKNGDCYDRYMLRSQEMVQSHRICMQALERLQDDGPWVVDDRKLILPPKAEVRQSMEALIHHFKIVQYGFDVPAGEVYMPIESPKGELALYLVSNGKNHPWRVRVRPPSFYHVHALTHLLKDQMLADMVAVIASVDPVFGEVDR